MAVSGHRNESSIRIYSRTDISTKRKMSETLTTECEVRGEEVAINPHQLSPVISLSQEEFIVQNSHSEITKKILIFSTVMSTFIKRKSGTFFIRPYNLTLEFCSKVSVRFSFS